MRNLIRAFVFFTLTLFICPLTLQAQIITGTHTFIGGNEGFDFSAGTVVAPFDSLADVTYAVYDVNWELVETQIVDMGEVHFDSIFVAPDSGYQAGIEWQYSHVYVVKTKESHYAKLKATETDRGLGFKWAYQPDGSTNLRTITHVEDERDDIYRAKDFQLLQNYPNPFNSSTTFRVSVPDEGYLRLLLFNLNGQLVKTLFDGRKGRGEYQIRWDGSDEASRIVASGLYLCVLRTKANLVTQKVIFQK